jgi:hypothetical protein
MNETFVVRIWEPSDAGERRTAALRGFVEHVGEPGRRVFAGEAELVAAIRAALEPANDEEEAST